MKLFISFLSFISLAQSMDFSGDSLSLLTDTQRKLTRGQGRAIKRNQSLPVNFSDDSLSVLADTQKKLTRGQGRVVKKDKRFAVDSSDDSVSALTALEEKLTGRQGRVNKKDKALIDTVAEDFTSPNSQYQPPKPDIHYMDFYNGYIARLKKKKNLTADIRRDVFKKCLEEGTPFHSPVKVGDNTYYFLRGTILPSPRKARIKKSLHRKNSAQKSIRKENFKRAFGGKNFIQTSPRSKQVMNNQMHHVAQRNSGEMIIDMPDSIHHGFSKFLHNSNKVPSAIDRSAFERDKIKARRILIARESRKFSQWQGGNQAKTVVPALRPKISTRRLSRSELKPRKLDF